MPLFFGGIGVLTIVLLFISIFGENQIPEDKTLRKTVTKSIAVIKTKPLSDSLTIDMVRLTSFKWDTLYVFRGYSSENFISQAIGTTWNDGRPSSWLDESPDNLFIFMNKRKVVSYVWYQGVAYGNEPASDFIHFQMFINNGELFTPVTAKFTVCREKNIPHFIQFFVNRKEESVYRPGFDRQNFNYFEQ